MQTLNDPLAEHPRLASVRAGRVLGIGVALLVLLGTIRAESFGLFAGYIVVLAAAALPSFLWIRAGAIGIPMFPVIAAAHIPYFAVPLVSGNQNIAAYTDWDLVRAAFTVALYLVIATLVWHRLARRSGSSLDSRHGDLTRVVRLIFVGIAMGLAFHITILSGSFGWMGSFYGVVRSLVITFCTIACFLTGVTRAQGGLQGSTFVMAIVGIALIIILAWTSLFLVGGTVYGLAAIFGYVIVSRRIPWRFVALILAVVSVLHSGKGDMRTRYWLEDANYGSGISVTGIPAFVAEWGVAGIKAIASGEVANSALERASLLQMLLKTQTEAPDLVPFLDGETYAMAPSILVPRFIDSSKPASQIGMDLLNIHYGLLTIEDAAVTAIGWGLLAEAYANFGYWGVIGIAIALGALCGGLALWSTDREVVSIPTLMSITAMMVLINLELDFIQVCSILFQGMAAVLIFFAIYGWFVIRPQRRASGIALRY
jgi:hypothetical protein